MGKQWVRYPDALREAVRQKRRDGLSIKRIASAECLSSSTVSLWVRDIVLADAQIAEIARNRARLAGASSSRLNEARREQWRMEARQLWDDWRHEPLFLLGVGMYWGEGSKRMRKFAIANSDPTFIATWLRWCDRYAPGVPRYLEVATHPDVPEDEARSFWSGVAGGDCKLRVFRVKLWKRGDNETVRLPHGVANAYLSHGVEWHTKMLEWLRLAAVM